MANQIEAGGSIGRREFLSKFGVVLAGVGITTLAGGAADILYTKVQPERFKTETYPNPFPVETVEEARRKVVEYTSLNPGQTIEVNTLEPDLQRSFQILLLDAHARQQSELREKQGRNDLDTKLILLGTTMTLIGGKLARITSK